MIALWIALAGSFGAVARLVLDGMIRSRRSTEFPWATVVINVTGSLTLGLLTGVVLFHGASRAAVDRRCRVLRWVHHIQHRQLRNGAIDSTPTLLAGHR